MDPVSKRTFIVTGGNSGIGLETARRLADMGARVVITVRDASRGQIAVADIRFTSNNTEVSWQMLDLASLADVRRAAAAIVEECPRIDGLINNAGIHDLRGGTTKEGVQKTFGTNYVGPFLLTKLLVPRLLETASLFGESRLVNVSSPTHRFALRFDPDNPVPLPWPRNREPYAESKLANILHAREIARRYSLQGLKAHSVNPGYAVSNFYRKDHWPGILRLAYILTRPWQISARQGAMPSVLAATSAEAGQVETGYWSRRGLVVPKLPIDADSAAERLWKMTEDLIAEISP